MHIFKQNLQNFLKFSQKCNNLYKLFSKLLIYIVNISIYIKKN